jgi:hypothetical protein
MMMVIAGECSRGGVCMSVKVFGRDKELRALLRKYSFPQATPDPLTVPSAAVFMQH